MTPAWGFSENLFADLVEIYVQADEPERALWILNNLPSWHRESPPPKLLKLKQEILSSLMTPRCYLQSHCDRNPQKGKEGLHVLQSLLRGRLIINSVNELNENNITPHIIDMGPGEFFIPYGLKQLGNKFTYQDIGMDQETKALTQDLERSKPTGEYTIFVANELIEHLGSPIDIAIEAHVHSPRIDEVHLSTPLFCFDPEYKEWRKPNGLPHLRTYSVMEFIAASSKIFAGFNWEHSCDGHLQSLVGKKIGLKHNNGLGA